MADKKSRQDIKQNQKKLYGLKEKLKKLELRPCQGDTDMKQKNEV